MNGADDRKRAKGGPTALLLRVAIILGIFLLAVFIGYPYLKNDQLPIFRPSQLDQRLVDPSVLKEQGTHHIHDFDLIDQTGQHLTLDDVKGRIIIADFFFTTCTSICPKMSSQMTRVQQAYKDDDRVVILSHSVTPEMDSVPVLQAYADRFGADPAHWHLLTGDRKQIYDLARRSYFAAVTEGDGGPDDFVHTENFVLVDPQLRIRGFYDGTSTADVDRLISDIGKLLREIRDTDGTPSQAR
ncbi:MAG: SCO family protein [Flavobacteriales bacterium]|nr:SCO family protein [Flavobacteriales bacterium]MCB9194337.1 SCO family protein [Flavobacteriales bacterium]